MNHLTEDGDDNNESQRLNMFFVQILAHCILPDKGSGTEIFDSLLNIVPLSAPCIV